MSFNITHRTCPAPGGLEIAPPDPGRGGWPVGGDAGEEGRLESDCSTNFHRLTDNR